MEAKGFAEHPWLEVGNEKAMLENADTVNILDIWMDAIVLKEYQMIIITAINQDKMVSLLLSTCCSGKFLLSQSCRSVESSLVKMFGV